MAILLYSNGIIEEYKPQQYVFTEEELVNLFNEYDEIKTERMIEVLNTWCIYGNNFTEKDPIEFNKIASEIITSDVYSYVLFIHDSEINPEWKVSDSILYKGYDEFLVEIRKYIDTVATDIIQEIESQTAYEDETRVVPVLETIGPTKDKRVLFGFNPNEQTTGFYENNEFYIFSQKVYDYISKNKQEKEPFTIYADKKAIIIVEKNHVVSLLNLILEKFKNEEEYEACTVITNIIKKWGTKSKKTTRRRKTSDKT